MLNLGFYSAGHISTNVRIYPTIVDRILEATALLFMLVFWGCTLWIYMHVSKESSIPPLFILAGVNTLVYLLLAWGAYMPIRLINFPVRITEQNVAIQWFLAKRLCRVLNIIVSLLFLSLVFMEVEQEYGLPKGFCEIGTAVTAVLTGIALIVYYIIAFRNKK